MIRPFVFLKKKLLWPLLTSRSLSVTRSPMVNHILSLLMCMIYYPLLRLTFGLPDLMLNYPSGKPHIMFLFVTSVVCLTLPSDSFSRRTPLQSASDSRQQARSGLEPYQYMVCMAHKKEECLIIDTPLYAV